MGAIEKIKLLILTPTLQCGGSEKYVSLLCNNINTQKFDVTLVVLNNSIPFYNISNHAVSVVDLKVNRARNSLFKIVAMIKSHKPNIVFSTANHLNLYLAIFKNWLPKNVILIARESSIVSINSKRAKSPALYTWLLKSFYKRIDHIICQSLYMQQDLIGNFNVDKNKTIVINNAVEAPESTIDDFLHKGNLNKVKFVTVARLSEEKGIDRLIRAVAKLSLPYSYHIIGSGKKKHALQVLINEMGLQHSIFLEGEKHDPFAGMEDAALFLMGSYYEGFPNTVLEANTIGIPVIAFNVPGGINEIITNGENGFLVNEDNENKFTQAIERALQTNFEAQKIKASTRSKYSILAITKATEDLFTQLCQPSKANS